MKQNYYEILEVDKNASPEIIKKAYTTLAKKYHPDLQDDDVKHLYEEKFKLINEAYETLSDTNRKSIYDKNLITESVLLKQQLKKLTSENRILKSQIIELQSIYKNSNIYDNNLNNFNTFACRPNTNIRNHIPNTYQNNDYNRHSTINNYEKPASFFKQLIKNIFSFIITCAFFYIMLRLIFTFSLFK